MTTEHLKGIKDKVIEFANLGIGMNTICKRLKIPENAVDSIVKKLTLHHTIQTLISEDFPIKRHSKTRQKLWRNLRI